MFFKYKINNFISIQPYGLFIFMGLILFLYLFFNDKESEKLINCDDFFQLLYISILSAYFGGKLLYLIEENNCDLLELFKFYNPGLSSLGAVIALLIIVPIYLKIKKIKILETLDKISLYAPILHSVSRLGCFFAGCCYGAKTDSFFSVIYTDQDSLAPLFQSIYPTQLYSSFLLFLIFIFLKICAKKKNIKLGSIFFYYIVLNGCERFFIDFLRGDRTISFYMISNTQIIAVVLILATILVESFYKKNESF